MTVFLRKAESSIDTRHWSNVDHITRQKEKSFEHERGKFYEAQFSVETAEHKAIVKYQIYACLSNLFSNSFNKEYFNLSNANVTEAFRVIINLRNICSTGNENILVLLKKSVAEYLSLCLVQINIQFGKIFPTKSEKAGRCPVPKVNTPELISGYPTISLLTVPSCVDQDTIRKSLSDQIEKGELSCVKSK